MVSDITLVVNAVSHTLGVQTFDGTSVRRTCAIDDNTELILSISHEETKSGITRSLAKIEERFVNSANIAELGAAHFVLTYKSGEGRTVAKQLATALMAWLTAESSENLISLGAKQYGA